MGKDGNTVGLPCPGTFQTVLSPHPANSAAESWGLLQDQGHGWGMALCEDVAALVQWFHVPALCRQGGGLGAGVTFPEDGPFREQWLV